MEIRQLEARDTKQFCDLILNMYSNLDNLEWFSPMPYDFESVQNMIQKPRFFILGWFENGELCAVSSLDYKCGKLIGKIEFPSDCNTEKLVEMGFNIVHSKHRGKGIMKQLISVLLQKIKTGGFEYVFSKVHENNIASAKSFLNNGFQIHCAYSKPVQRTGFVEMSNQEFFSEKGKENAKQTLQKLASDEEEFFVNYNIWIKKL